MHGQASGVYDWRKNLAPEAGRNAAPSRDVCPRGLRCSRMPPAHLDAKRTGIACCIPEVCSPRWTLPPQIPSTGRNLHFAGDAAPYQQDAHLLPRYRYGTPHGRCGRARTMARRRLWPSGQALCANDQIGRIKTHKGTYANRVCPEPWIHLPSSAAQIRSTPGPICGLPGLSLRHGRRHRALVHSTRQHPKVVFTRPPRISSGLAIAIPNILAGLHELVRPSARSDFA